MLKPLDLERIGQSLTTWLGAKIPDAEEISVSNLVRPSLGMSNDTALFDVTTRQGVTSQTERLVARLMPTDRLVFPEYNLSHQYRVMERLARTEIPVPPMRWYEGGNAIFGAPFYVMGAIDGEAPSDVPPYHSAGLCFEATPAERERIWWNGLETLAAIHRLDWRGLGLDFLGVPADADAAVVAQLDYWESYLEWVRTDEPQPVLDATKAWLRENRVHPKRMTLCWGDSRLGNILFKDCEVVAVLDWEMAFIGDPEADVAWWLFLDWNHSEGYNIPRLEGFPDRDATVARYEALTGAKLENLFYYEVFAAYRFGAIMAKIATILRENDLPMPTEDFASNNPCTQRLAELLGLPAPGSKS